PATEVVFLGLVDGAPRFGHGLAPAATETLKSRNDLMVTALRSISVQGLVAPDHLPPIAEAKAVLHWHARHRFCPNCGAATKLVCGGWKRDFPQCKAEHFPRTDPVVIMLATDGERCLLGRSARFGGGVWSCLARVVAPRATVEDDAAPASANRARPSRRRRGARYSKRPASSPAASLISPRSRGRSRCR